MATFNPNQSKPTSEHKRTAWGELGVDQPPYYEKACLLGSRVDVEVKIFKILTPSIGKDIIKPP